VKILDQMLIFYLNLGIKYGLTTFSQKLSKCSNVLTPLFFCCDLFVSTLVGVPDFALLQKGLALSFCIGY